MRALAAVLFLASVGLVSSPCVFAALISWEQMGPGAGGPTFSIGIDPTNSDRIFVSADTGWGWRSVDGGDTWEPLGDKPGMSDRRYQINGWAFDPDNGSPGSRVFAATPNGLLMSDDGGDIWVNLTETKTFLPCSTFPGTGEQDLDDKFFAVAVTPGSTAIYLGAGDWQATSLPLNNSRIYRSINMGITWRLVAQGIADDNCTKNLPADANIFTLQLHPDDDRIVYGSSDQGLFMTANGGGAWSGIDSTLPTCDGQINARYMDLHWDGATTTTLYVAMYCDGGIYKAVTTDPADTLSYSWNQTGVTFPYQAQDSDCKTGMPLAPVTLTSTSNFRGVTVDPNDASIVLAVAGDYRVPMIRSTDGGATWIAITDGLPPEYEWALQHQYCPYPQEGSFHRVRFAPQGNGEVFALKSAVFKSVNGGASWQNQSSDNQGTSLPPTGFDCTTYVPGNPAAPAPPPCPPTIRSAWNTRGIDPTWGFDAAFDPNVADTFYLGFADISLWRTADDGASFSITTEPDKIQGGQAYGIAVNPVSSDVYVVHGWHSNNSKEGLWVSKSTDSGGTFTDFSNGLPGSPTGKFCWDDAGVTDGNPCDTTTQCDPPFDDACIDTFCWDDAGNTDGMLCVVLDDCTTPFNDACRAKLYDDCVYDYSGVANPCSVLTPTRARYPLALDSANNMLYMARPGDVIGGFPLGHGVFKTPLGSANWTPAGLGCPHNPPPGLLNCHVNSLAVANNVLWAGGDGFVARSEDGGANWCEVAFKDADPLNEVTGRVETLVIVNTEDMVADTDVVYAAVSEFRSSAPSVKKGKLLRVSQSGTLCEDWVSEMVKDGAGDNQFDGLNRVRVVAADPAHPGRLYVGANNSSSPSTTDLMPGLYISDDPTHSSPTWQFEVLPHTNIESMVRSPHAPNQLLVGTRGGGFFRGELPVNAEELDVIIGLQQGLEENAAWASRDDAYFALREGGAQRRLRAVWTFSSLTPDIPYELAVEAHSTDENFSFRYATRNDGSDCDGTETYQNAIVVTKTSDDDMLQTISVPQVQAGVFYCVLARDSGNMNDSFADTLRVDRLFLCPTTGCG